MDTYLLKKAIHDAFFSDICQPTINRLSTENLHLESEQIDIKHQKDVLQTELDECEISEGVYQSKIDELNQMITTLKAGGQVEDPMATYWDNKHPPANIRYVARPSIYYKGEMNSIDVRQFIVTNDFEIEGFIKNRNFYIKDPMHLDKIVPKIYRKHQLMRLKYHHDKDVTGFSEYWMYPYELRELNEHNSGGDCDDMAISLVSHLRTAGVPDWRVRAVVGDTQVGGHATVYVLDDSLDVWRHINSTSFADGDKLTDYPTFGDETDRIGIKKDGVWFSFNDKHAWHKFETKAAEDSFKKHRMDKKVIIQK